MQTMEINSGIYQIKNIINNKKYIGKSKNIKKRLENHKGCLLRNNHDNSHLQRAYNKYGLENFEFSILVNCPPEYNTKMEQWFLDNYINFSVDYNQSVLSHAASHGHMYTEEEYFKIVDLIRSGIPSKEIIKIIGKGTTHRLSKIFNKPYYRNIPIPISLKTLFNKVNNANRTSDHNIKYNKIFVAKVKFLLNLKYRTSDIATILNVIPNNLHSLKRQKHYKKSNYQLSAIEIKELNNTIKKSCTIKSINIKTGEIIYFYNIYRVKDFIINLFPHKNPTTLVKQISITLKGKQKTAYGFKWEYLK